MQRSLLQHTFVFVTFHESYSFFKDVSRTICLFQVKKKITNFFLHLKKAYGRDFRVVQLEAIHKMLKYRFFSDIKAFSAVVNWCTVMFFYAIGYFPQG